MKKQILNEEFIRMQKLAGILNENENLGPDSKQMKIFDLKDKNNESTELFKIENFTNIDEAITILKTYLNTDFLRTDQTGNEYNYAYVAGDGDVKFVKSLDEFSDGYKTEKEWGVISSEEITQDKKNIADFLNNNIEDFKTKIADPGSSFEIIGDKKVATAGTSDESGIDVSFDKEHMLKLFPENDPYNEVEEAEIAGRKVYYNNYL